jgi:hypothetical protein
MKPLTITIVLVGMVSTLVSCNLKVSEDVKTTPIGYENTVTIANIPSPIISEPTSTTGPRHTTIPTHEATIMPTSPTSTSPSIASTLTIAFTRDNEVWLWKNGSETPLAEAPIESLDNLVSTNKIALSDDGQVIAFTKGDKEVWSIKIDGTAEKRLMGESFFESLAVDRPYKMDWLPKSHTLLFNTFSHVQTGVYKPSYDFHWIDVDTGTLKTIAHAGKGGNFYPSPDGKTIILVSPESLTMTDINGNHQRTLLTYPHYPVSGEFNFLPAVEPIWAEDSKSFVIAIPELNFSELSPIAVTRFWHVSTVTQSSELMAQVDLDSFSSPVISPDLTRVIYQKAPSDNHEENKLYLAQIDFSDETLIDIHKDQLPYLISWSPDSKHYVMIFASTGTLLGNNEGKTELIDEDNLRGIQKYRWLDLTRFLTINEQNELRLGIIGAPTSILITTLGDNYDVFDFVY